MIEIDGSIGEGGGQILRTSISLSSLFQKSVRIYNIRAKRSKPGLKLQHTIGIRAAADISNAKIEGAKIGSEEVIYEPSEIKGGNYNIEISTAGSISLVLQVLMPIVAFSPKKVKLMITGGTDVKWSPPVDYVKYVISGILKRMGFNFNINIIRRGHYPKGGGKVISDFTPVRHLNGLNPEDYDSIKEIKGISHCCRLPEHVAIRQMKSANKTLKENNYPEAKIEVETYKRDEDPHRGPGSGIVLFCIPDNDIPIGGDALGARGKRAEIVGREAAQNLIKELDSKTLLDKHAADIIVPYIGLAHGKSKIKVRKLTNHIKTNIEITEKFLENRYKVQKLENGLNEISIEGINYTNEYIS
ncbi:MAG: RNA 3'-terminal phosphate cyclase [Candidatus Lokiarchaeota archaeon]|nr:RNA 3'-terminal phosphate cyclase [Candidatus Lokiarchaeota archaeon]